MQDRSTYVGEVIDNDDETITMDLDSGARIVIPRNRIRKVTTGTNKLYHPKGKFHYTKGFFFSFSVAMNPFIATEQGGITEHSDLLIGWRFNKDLSLAIGFGSELSSTNVGGFEVDTWFNSYFLYGRYYLADWRHRPYTYARIGYGTGPDQEFEAGRHGGGLQGQVGVGFHFASRRKSKFNISIGYHFQKTEGGQSFLDTFGNEVDIDYNLLIREAILKFTYEFR